MEKVQEAINTLNKIVDKHAPIKLASQSKQRQLNKSWLTKGILKSVKRKQKMYRTHFLSKDLQKIGEYKHYMQLFFHILRIKVRQNTITCNLQSTKTTLRWLDTVFQGQYLPSLSINYVAINKVLEKLPPQLY